MPLAFWRRKNSAGAGTSSRSSRSVPSDDESGARSDPSAALRVRARRRLIGAAALLLLAVIVVPMVLDPEPKPVPDNIPIDIPSEKTKFTPRLALPPPAAEPAPLTPPPDAPAPAATAPSPDASKVKPGAGADEAKAEAERARAALEGKAAADKPVKGGKFAVQAAATANETSARELSERLRKAGLPAYTERHETTEGARFRVRVGPYGSRDEADRARARLKTLGISANVVVT